MLERDASLEITAFVSRDADGAFLNEIPWRGDVEWVRLPVGIGGPPGHVLLEAGAQMGLVAARAVRGRLHVVHGLANVAPVGGGRFARVVTLLDVTWIHQPEVMDWRARAGTYAMALASARAAHRVIAISRTAAHDVVEHLGVDAGRVDVVPLGVRGPEPGGPPPLGAEATRARFGLAPGPLVLCVGQVREHKNVPGLVRALARLPQAGVQLAVAGMVASEDERGRILEAARQGGVDDRVHVLGPVSDPELEGLYAAADCFALGSFHEGFGLPVLEAMARGVPVACSGSSALGEVAGDAAQRFDPRDDGSISAALERVLFSPALAGELVERGLERAREFTWERTAEGTLESYRRALRARRDRGRGADGRR